MGSSGTATVTLPTDTPIPITREFDAPRHLVYKAWTTPELIKRWLLVEIYCAWDLPIALMRKLVVARVKRNQPSLGKWTGVSKRTAKAY